MTFKKVIVMGFGANGRKTYFLKVLSGEIQPNSGSVNIEPGNRLSILEQIKMLMMISKTVQSWVIHHFMKLKGDGSSILKKISQMKMELRLENFKTSTEMDGWNADSGHPYFLSWV